MCLKPQPPRPMPPELAAWGDKHLAEGDPYKMVGDLLYDQYRDEEFLDCYHVEGKPGVSPVLLSFVTVFQALENLSDRKAVQMLQTRLDWKYALHLPIDADGFDPSVLCTFRARLISHDAEARVFERLLTQLTALGLLKSRGRQRTDSIAILSKARSLHRLELLVDTLRHAVHELLDIDPDWTRATIPADWEEHYGRCCKSARLSEDARAALAARVGKDMHWLLEQVQPHEALREIHAIAILQTVWSQHFVLTDEQVTLTPRNVAPGADQIETPYDPEARWSCKGDQNWVGHKLQVTETDDDDKPHLITDIAVTSAVTTDGRALEAIRERQKERNILPSERYADAGYVDGPNIRAGRTCGEDLIGPIRSDPSAQARMPDGLTHADFVIDFEQMQVTCPNGHTTTIFRAKQEEGFQAIFPVRYCDACPLRARCYTGTGKKSGRSLRFGPYYAETQFARQRQHTDEFQIAYRKHRGGVEACLSALVRGQGIRVSRYWKRATNNLRMLFVGVAVNIARSAAWRAGHRPKKRRACLGLAPATG